MTGNQEEAAFREGVHVEYSRVKKKASNRFEETPVCSESEFAIADGKHWWER